MKYSDLRPDRLPRRPRRDEGQEAKDGGPGDQGDADGSAAASADPGPRPLSARQREYGTRRRQQQRRAAAPAATVEPASGLKRRRAVAPPKPRRRLRRLRNRRRPHVPRVLLRVAVAALLVECVVALLFSPRLWVRTVRVEGVETIPERRIFERMGLPPRTNLVRVPVARLRAVIEADPVVARAEVRRIPPGTLRVTVEERKPRILLKAGGSHFTLDRGFVPFRKPMVSDASLPVLALESIPADAVRWGKQIVFSERDAVNTCLTWADDVGFPLRRIAVDQTGKLCLNGTDGGAEFRLGSDLDLKEKLDALQALVALRADLVGGKSVAYVNLYYQRAPAILARDNGTPEGADPAPSAVP